MSVRRAVCQNAPSDPAGANVGIAVAPLPTVASLKNLGLWHGSRLALLALLVGRLDRERERSVCHGGSRSTGRERVELQMDGRGQHPAPSEQPARGTGDSRCSRRRAVARVRRQHQVLLLIGSQGMYPPPRPCECRALPRSQPRTPQLPRRASCTYARGDWARSRLIEDDRHLVSRCAERLAAAPVKKGGSTNG
jgi:hypothetical protein